MGRGPLGSQLGSQHVGPCRAAGRWAEAGLEEESAPHCVACGAVLGEGQEPKAPLGPLAHQETGVDPGGASVRVGGSLVDQRLEHLGEAVGMLQGDGEELSSVEECADPIGGSKMRAPEGREVDAALVLLCCVSSLGACRGGQGPLVSVREDRGTGRGRQE